MSGKSRAEFREGMQLDHSTCEDLFGASKAMFKESGLVSWEDGKFVSVYGGESDDKFEKWLEKKFDHQYGRYICWVLFSVAAENLAKAACVCSGVVKPTVKKLPYPRYDGQICLMDWASKVLSNQSGTGPAPIKYDYHTLVVSQLWNRKDKGGEVWIGRPGF